MTYSKHTRTIRTVVLAVLLITATISMPMSAVAQSDDDNPVDGWLETVNEQNSQEDDGGILSRVAGMAPDAAVDVLAVVDGQLDRAISNPFSSTPSNQQIAEEFDEKVAAHDGTYEETINENTNITTAYDTHAVIIGHEDGGDAVSVYLVGDVKSGNISNLRVLSESKFNETDREIDELWVVDGDAAKDLPELTTNLAERITSEDAIGQSYQRRLGGRYCSLQSPFSRSIVDLKQCDIRSTMWLDEQAVLEGGTD